MSAACPICGAADSRRYWDKVWGAPGKTVQACNACGSFFLWPPSSAAEQAEFDRGYAQYIAVRARAVEPHAGAEFGVLVEDSIAVRLADIGTWFDGAVSVLEIGAETGGFLDRLHGRCARLVGVDAAPEYAAILKSKGYGGHRYIEDVPAATPFDRVCCFSLLEHIREPAAFLARASALLAPGGRMVIEVPSARDPLLALYELPAFKDFYFQAMHPQVFSPQAVEMLLKRAGFGSAEVRFKQRYGLANHLQWLRKGVPGGAPDLARMFADGADHAYVSALEKAGMTDTVYISAARTA